MLSQYFFGVVESCFLLGILAKTDGWMCFFVVKLWIAGESWEVDGQFSGSKLTSRHTMLGTATNRARDRL